MTKFSGAALWAKKEAHAGDRLPYLSLVDENVALLRDGSLMLSLLVGAALTVLSDVIARTAFPSPLPVGIITAVVGAPYLLYLLARHGREART